MDNNFKCPRCGYDKTVRVGHNLTKKWGNRPRRKCKRCATTFYEPTVDISNSSHAGDD